MPPPVLGEVGGFSFFLFFFGLPARDYPQSVFGGRGDFFSRLGAGGGGGDRLSETRKGETRLASPLSSVSY